MTPPLDPTAEPIRPHSRPARNARERRVAQGPLEDLVGYHLRRANGVSFGILQQFVPELDVTAGQFGMLALIAANPGLSQSELGRAQGIDKSTVAPAIGKLERRGLVERRVAPRDRRSKALYLTVLGQELYAAAEVRVTAADAQLTRDLSQDEKSDLIRLLLKLYI